MRPSFSIIFMTCLRGTGAFHSPLARVWTKRYRLDTERGTNVGTARHRVRAPILNPDPKGRPQAPATSGRLPVQNAWRRSQQLVPQLRNEQTHPPDL